MLRYLFALALAFPAMLVPLSAQIYTIQPRPMLVDNKPHGGFSLSFRYGGSTNVRFEDVGAVASLREIGDLTSESLRIYDDGLIGFDTRGGGGNVADDGRTNRWGYGYESQITPEGDIAFHQYSTTSNGRDLEVDSGDLAGVDMQYDMVFGVFGPKVGDRTWAFTWGGMASGVFSPINTKARDTVAVNLVTTTDIYSLEGAAIPRTDPTDSDGDGVPDIQGYNAPSTTPVTIKDSSGNDVNYTVDNTTLISNRPYSRIGPTTTIDGAEVTGFWQVKGAYYTLRLGPWFRWQFGRRLSLRASVGASYTFLGVDMEYDELVDADDLESSDLLRAGVLTTPETGERFGYFGALDAEWWLTDRTGFFAGVTVEDTGDDVVLTSGDPANGGRRAVIELPNGTGFRVGMSVLF